jgi:hypothetical protein
MNSYRIGKSKICKLYPFCPFVDKEHNRCVCYLFQFSPSSLGAVLVSLVVVQLQLP